MSHAEMHMFQTEIDTSQSSITETCVFFPSELCMFKNDTFTSQIETHKPQAETPITQTEINVSC